ncbi:MAG: VOC family protein [Imperialibacter sp.]|uniref:VOC family protein n=1 Tax=Imperialibacter sp. TaxID=2038411 RepID=UPI0030D8C26A|tara:strand:+ start:1281 stop:1664 length:384 start_codon:yes stop_codon:yes gene_type:complete
MKIEHIALWTTKLEELKDFYTTYFAATAGEKYHNPTKQFTSYFLSFDSGARLEIMARPEVELHPGDAYRKGLIHWAMSVGSKEKVNQLTEQLRKDGFEIIGEPRTTGDGYYESVVADPDGNLVEITT